MGSFGKTKMVGSESCVLVDMCSNMSTKPITLSMANGWWKEAKSKSRRAVFVDWWRLEIILTLKLSTFCWECLGHKFSPVCPQPLVRKELEYMCVCVCLCVCIYIYIYIYIFEKIKRWNVNTTRKKNFIAIKKIIVITYRQNDAIIRQSI